MFTKTNFTVIEIREENGVEITHFLRGKRSEVKKDVDDFKQKSKKYEMKGKKVLVAWF